MGASIQNEWVALRRNKAAMGMGIGFVLLALLSMVLADAQYQTQKLQVQEAQAHLRAQWDSIEAMNPHGAAHYGTYIFKPANALTHLDEGVGQVTGNVIRVEGHVQNEMVHSEAAQMAFVSKFGKLKAALLLQFVLPLVLIFLAFHSVSNEKNSGRLKLLVLQNTTVRDLVWSKALAIWCYGLSLLVLTVLGYALFQWGSLGQDQLLRLLLFVIAYALYLFVVVGLTVAASARWANTTRALTTALGLWIFWTMFLPNTLMTAVEKWHPLPSRNAFQNAMREDRAQGLDGHNPSDERGKALEAEYLAEYGVDSVSQLPINFDGIRMQADEEYGNQVWDKHFGEIRTILDRQKRSYQWAGSFNPFIALQNASKGLAASDNIHHQTFLLDVEQYRRGFIKALNDEHAYGGSKTGEWSWKAENAFFRSVPDFKYTPMPLSTVWHRYAIDLAILLGWTVLTAFLLSFWASKSSVL
jgi:ABC-2 type transport system permease protein